MRLPATCMMCAAQRVPTATDADGALGMAEPPWMEVVATGDGVADLECGHGHRMIVAFQGGGHALLYERALQNLARRASRDAVMDAHTAFEMFVGSIPIRCYFDTHGGSLEEIDKLFIRATKTGERAIGAAETAFLLRVQRPPPRLAEKHVNLRNYAVHRGRSPNAHEAKQAVLAVGETILEYEHALATATPDQAVRYWLAAFALATKTARESGRQLSTAMLNLVLDFVGEHEIRDSPADRLAKYERGEPHLPII